MLKIFRHFISNHPKEFIFLFFILIIEGFIASLAVISIAPLADFLVNSSLNDPSFITLFFITILNYLGFSPSLLVFSLFFISTNLLRGFLEIGIKYAVLVIKYKVQKDIVLTLLHKIFKAKWSFVSNNKKGRLLNTFDREVSIVGDTLGHLTMQFAQLFQLIIYLIVPIWINAQMTITAMALAIIFALPFLLLHKINYKLGQENTRTRNNLMSIMYEAFNGIKLIMGFSKQEKSLIFYKNGFDMHVNATIKSQTLAQSIHSIFQPIGIAAAIISLFLAINSEVKISEASIVLWSLFRAMPIMGTLLGTNLSISNFVPSYEQLMEIQNNAIKEREVSGQIKFEELKDSIRLSNVGFSYSRGVPTLKNINIEIKKNKRTAIVGETGSGKSTIIDLILGFQNISEGEIFYDDISFRELDLNSFRKKVGYVPQDAFLFNGTIKENLLWAIDIDDENKLNLAIEKAGIKNFIESLPDGINTQVGDNGVKLSGGQKQRISLARSLIREPEILLLDEATSSLDSETENEIQNTLGAFNGKITSVIIAHRLSTIIDAEQIYVLNNGKIIESGSYRDLKMKNNSYFRKMLKAQKILK